MKKRFLSGCLVLVASTLTLAAGPNDRPPLIQAVKDGDQAATKLLMQRKVDVNAAEADGSTALHWAAYANDLATVDALLKAGASVKATNKFGVSPLAVAAEAGNASLVERFLKAGADPNTTQFGSETVLMTAARTGTADVLRLLLAAGAAPNAKETTHGQTALMWAAAGGHTAAIKVLIEAGAEVKARSSELKAAHENKYVFGRKDADSGEKLPMFTPIMFTALRGHIDAARALLDAGANVNDAGPDGTPLLHIATLNGNWEYAARLLEWGADPKVESNGGTALHHISHVRAAKVLVKTGGIPGPVEGGSMSSLELAKRLVAAGADVNARITKPGEKIYGTRAGTRTGMTPLMLATMPADPQYLRTLLALGADPKMKTNNRTTVLMMAAGLELNSLLGDDEEALEILHILTDLGLDVNDQNDVGDAALHGAAFRDSNAVIEFLVSKGAKLDVKNSIGWTPLMEAAWTGRGLFNTRPGAEKLFRSLYEKAGLPIVVPTRDEAIEKLVDSKGGPIISCPDAVTVKAAGPQGAVINYPEATATSRRRYGTLKTTCTPGTGATFPIGNTVVTCTATDQNNRTDSCALIMKVEP